MAVKTAKNVPLVEAATIPLTVLAGDDKIRLNFAASELSAETTPCQHRMS